MPPVASGHGCLIVIVSIIVSTFDNRIQEDRTMASTCYTIEALKKIIANLKAMYPRTKLGMWGIEAFDNRAPRIWADFVPSDGSDLIHAYRIL